MTRIDWLVKLTYYLQTLAFCLSVSAIQFAIQPGRSYELPLVYSVCIGTFTWGLIDFGRHAFASSAETGWPAGPSGWLLPVAGIVGGYVLGTLAGDTWFGWSSWSEVARSQLPVSIIITAIAGVVGTYYFYSRNKALYFERKMSEARRHASEARLKLLETQLEPHMMFNTLANLRVLIGTDPARAQDMLDRMIAYLRATLGASRNGTHHLQAEFDRLRDYLELMAVRMGPRLRYTLELPPQLAAVPVPTLLLQPLVENSIKHGLEPKVEGGRVTVRARQEGNMLVLDVSDTGVGFDTAGPAGDGFGLAQVRDRLATAYGDLGRVAQQSQPGAGSVTQLKLPLATAAA
jgi:hypothetical protein